MCQIKSYGFSTSGEKEFSLLQIGASQKRNSDKTASVVGLHVNESPRPQISAAEPGNTPLSYILSAVVVGVVHSAVFPIALGVGMGSVHSTLIQKMAADVTHDASFAADPDVASALRK